MQVTAQNLFTSSAGRVRLAPAPCPAVIRIIKGINFAAFDLRRAAREAELGGCDQRMPTCDMSQEGGRLDMKILND